MIPKKLDINEVLKYEIAGELSVFVSKINQIIDYLQAKEDPENIIKAYKDLLDRQHEGEASKGEGGNKHGFKHDFEPDENGKCWCNLPKESSYHYQIDLPEHEEDFDRLAQGLRNHVIDDVRFSGLFEYVKDYIRDNFVSKEKIKREIEAYQHWAEETDRNIYAIPVGILHKKLGLGD